MAGTHNAVNAAGAIVLARRLGMDHEEIAGRLETFASLPMRNEIIELDGLTIVNDAYNANPASVAAALSVLESLPCRGRRIVVLGQMCELGNQSELLHRRIGQLLLGRGFDCVFLVGPETKVIQEVLPSTGSGAPRVYHCEDAATCQQMLLAELRDGDVVLLKASRAVGLEQLVEPLRQRWPDRAGV
jgi:UDP-N-acetylmuramoyl-tripeptide--D-alanyl-D-alanine ligase